MCGILFIHEKNEKDMKIGLEKIKHRGPDNMKIKVINNATIGFVRLSIMDLTNNGNQPFEYDKKYSIINGEIYNFQEIKDELKLFGFKFHSNSDCEVILPLYKICNSINDFANKINGEYAIVIYDEIKDEIIALRDPLGIRPLFYGYTKNGKIVFGSEMKAIMHLCQEIKPFPPGHYYYQGKFKKYYDPRDNKMSIKDEEIAKKMLKINLEKAVEKRIKSDANIGFLLSGGLDSSLVCGIAAKKIKEPIKTFAIGMNTDAIDLKYANDVAKYINSDHTEVIITKSDVLEAIDKVIYHEETFDITTIRAGIGMYLVTKYIHENSDIKVLLTGEVSDELFGYKYTDYAPDSAAFQKEAEKRIKEIYMYDVLRADRCLAANSLEARVPFADIEFVKVAMNIDPKLKMNNYDMGKWLIRKAFEDEKYIPDDILWRQKAAFSDAVGHSMVDYIKMYAEEKYTNEQYKTNREKYQYHKKPISKESLLYREIFEKYYPNKAKVIKDYWMPNKKWFNEKITDPSARVLKNYDKSGE